jgi:hypothetical protein
VPGTRTRVVRGSTPPAVHAAGRFNQKLTHADDRFPPGRLTTPTHSANFNGVAPLVKGCPTSALRPLSCLALSRRTGRYRKTLNLLSHSLYPTEGLLLARVMPVSVVPPGVLELRDLGASKQTFSSIPDPLSKCLQALQLPPFVSLKPHGGHGARQETSVTQSSALAGPKNS